MQRPLAQLVVFLVMMLLVTGLIHGYLYSRLVVLPDLSEPWRGRVTVALVVLAVALPVSIFLSRTLPRPVATVVALAGYTWMGLAVLLLFTLLPGEIVRVGHWIASGADPSPERRLFLSRVLAGTAAIASGGLGVLGVASALKHVQVTRVRVPLKKLPQELEGFRIVQLTDLHVGATLGRSWLEGIVRRVAALEADLVAITGDLVDGSVADLREHTAPLADLRAKHGVFFVTGNHEYYSGADDWIQELERLGVRVLRNERVAIERGGAAFDLAGVDDWSSKRFGRGHGADLGRALAGRDPSREVVLLAHQPKQAMEAAELGVGLQLSGHTHGGQIWPWGFLVRLDQTFVEGLHALRDTFVYVSRGTGYWGPPMRVFATAEIAVIELVRA